MSDKSFEELVGTINVIREFARESLPLIEEQVNLIVEQKLDDQSLIEQTLDSALSFVHLGFGEDLFQRLNQYYATISPEGAQDYNRMYQEFFGEE